jgi:hypothetical protein
MDQPLTDVQRGFARITNEAGTTIGAHAENDGQQRQIGIAGYCNSGHVTGAATEATGALNHRPGPASGSQRLQLRRRDPSNFGGMFWLSSGQRSWKEWLNCWPAYSWLGVRPLDRRIPPKSRTDQI